MGLKSIKLYFKKESHEYMDGNIDPFEFYSVFYLYLKLFRVVDKAAPKWTILTPIYVSFCGGLAAVFCFIVMVHRIKTFEIPLFTESGTYFIIMVYKLIILSCIGTDKKHFYNLLQAMRDDFEYICVKNTKYRAWFFKNHLFTRKASILASFFIFCVGASMILFSNIGLIFFLIFHDSNENKSRPLPFPFWLHGVDFGKSPVYEIALIFSNMCVISQMYTYVFMMQTQIVWVRQITSKVDVIIWSIQDLLIDIHPAKTDEEKERYAKLIKLRMREIIKMHHSMYRLIEDYGSVYRKFLMFEQKLCGPLVCLTAFSSAEKMDEGEIHFILIILCIAIIVLVFIPSYMCTFLSEKVRSISDACWGTPFWNSGPVIRPYLVLIMQRAVRPIPIQAPGFETVSIETFSNKLTSAYSAFNMLRQANFE